MDHHGRSTLERAFELARNGSCSSVEMIRHRLKVEQFSSIDSHLAGKSITAQLNNIIRARKSPIVDYAAQGLTEGQAG